MIKRAFLLILAAAVSSPAAAEKPDNPLPAGVAAFSEAYSAWDGAGFSRAARLLREAGRIAPESFPAHYWQGTANFHLALYLLDLEDPGREAGRALDSAEEALERALELDGECGECYALLAGVTGLQISRSPLSGAWRGSRFTRRSERALELSPENPRVHYLLGTNYHHAPRRLGGREKAREHFLTAVKLFEEERKTEAGPLQPRWGYDACLAFLGEVYLEEGDRERARDCFRRALAVNPNHGRAGEKLRELEKPEKEGL